MALRFVCDGELVELDGVAPGDTVLDFLRGRPGKTGTKEGCGEGDCGACTVLVGTPVPGADRLDWRAVNACIQFLPMLHGKAVLTVDGLGEGLNALQQTMACNGASQCGFCTPGFVMSLQGRAMGAVGCDLPVGDVLAGNLCRCTGYGPLLEAGAQHPPAGRDDAPLLAMLRGATGPACGHATLPDGRTARWFIPDNADALATLLAQYPGARIVAGATDVGLWVTKKLVDLETVIFVGDVPELGIIEDGAEGVTLGGAVRYADAHAALARLSTELGELVRRLGGLQVRNAGTVGGNIANGSPIGDGPPALIALGATLTLRSVRGRRTMPLEQFFIAYGQQDRAADEFVESVFVPRPGGQDVVHISKLSKRFDSDISAVCGAFRLTVEQGTITAARIAFGGMAATPRRAAQAEAVLTGAPFTAETMATAAEAIRADFAPLSDVRGSAAYRLEAAGNLVWRLWHQAQGQAVRVQEVAHG
ncbi:MULTISPECIES: xanthine dehydrogenase small subunit [unclassified Novosphingobium]|uniref:xanthine dehydrogenase small subunit n=1 Tax=unclassified Novosphingobium TaxID=2644732 RepID=UPI00146E08C7|nr:MULTISPECIES: xanthine dehydrogenase small subunit [unclassified Novosphingobium]NMN04356.1 xanthine dehydrogenase small subunit [Novosphingobium sp. SG919]NMN85653.1 xanthine dehydrogenase small subunit [Novosphingobium sp. SG916]